MAKSGTDRHPKILQLADILKLERWGAVGLCECLWLWSAEYAPLGDVGKYSDATIADGVGWRGDPDILIAALIEAKLLDLDSNCRLIIHDWATHRPEFVRKRAERMSKISDKNSDKNSSLTDSSVDKNLENVQESVQKNGRKTGDLSGDLSSRANPTQPNPTQPNPTTALRTFSEFDFGEWSEKFKTVFPKRPSDSWKAGLEKLRSRFAKGLDPGPVLRGAEALRRAVDDGRQDAQYVPNLQTWVNQDRWTADYAAVKSRFRASDSEHPPPNGKYRDARTISAEEWAEIQ